MSEIILRTEGLSKSFGAMFAVHRVSLEFERGLVHAVIGPNGAGKTTLINLLSGELKPTEGQVFFKEKNITKYGPAKTSQLGVGRSFQKTNIFPKFTCFENCWVAAQSRLSTSMRFFKPAYFNREVKKRAKRALELCRLSERTDTVVSNMSYGEQRQLEIGMMLATEPELLLLDEPLAGMGSEESLQVIDLLKVLAKDHTLILIEHDMDAVFSIADRLTVMVYGEELQTGDPDSIKNSPAVQEAYLGEEEIKGL